MTPFMGATEAAADILAALSADGWRVEREGEVERLREALAWTLRNNGSECPVDSPAGYARALRALGGPDATD